MRPLATRTLLFTSGAVLVVVGAAILFLPHAFFAANGIRLAAEPSSMSEVRSPGGLLLAIGIIVFLGAFRGSLTRLGLALSALVYGAYGGSRLVSLAFDGVPSFSLVAATALELLLAALSLAVLVASGGARFFPVALACRRRDRPASRSPA